MALRNIKRMWLQYVVLLVLFGRSCLAINYPKDICGLRPLKSQISRIVGGIQSKSGDWPWQVAVWYGKSFICSGSLINDEWIVTTATCFDGRTLSAPYYQISFGLNNGPNNKSSAQTKNVTHIIKHPNFKNAYPSYYDDIALIKLASKIEEFTEYYMPVCLPSVGQDFTNQTAYITGWGHQYYQGPLSGRLLETETSIWSDHKCTPGVLPNLVKVNVTKQVCVGGKGKGACQGDSGAPVTVVDQTRNDRYTLVGLISIGDDCKGTFEIATRVSAYRKWIESVLGVVLP